MMHARLRRNTRSRLAALVAVVAMIVAPAGATAAAQDDGGSGADAGDTFETATSVAPAGAYSGRLAAPEDVADFYRFHLDRGAFVSIHVQVDGMLSEPVVLFDPAGRPVDVATRAGVGVSAGAVVTQENGRMRLAVHRAIVAGEYRIRFTARRLETATYSMCFMNCEEPQQAPIDFVFGGSLRQTDTKVLLIPPTHGDLGNPRGPTVVDYIEATLRGIRRWTAALEAFANDYPEYSYLKEIELDVEVFDGVLPLTPVGYDVIVGYVAAGPVFRGVATDLGSWPVDFVRTTGFEDMLRYSGRYIALSLFGGSPRAGQVLYDFPELTDLENVTMHEFGHTFGLGHTLTWHPTYGPDLMNSPATFIYGDGSPVGDGGERTPIDCLSSLDLYGMAVLYRWVPGGSHQATFGRTDLPSHIPYKLYC